MSRLSDSAFRFGLVIYITMPDRAHAKVQELREMAARLLALALTASENGDVELLEQFVAAALECEDKASSLEAAASVPKKNRVWSFCDDK